MRALLAPNLSPAALVHYTCTPTLEPLQSIRPRPIPPQKTNTALPDLYLINPTCGKASPYTNSLPRVRFSSYASKPLLLILYLIKKLSTARLQLPSTDDFLATNVHHLGNTCSMVFPRRRRLGLQASQMFISPLISTSQGPNWSITA